MPLGREPCSSSPARPINSAFPLALTLRLVTPQQCGIPGSCSPSSNPTTAPYEDRSSYFIIHSSATWRVHSQTAGDRELDESANERFWKMGEGKPRANSGNECRRRTLAPRLNIVTRGARSTSPNTSVGKRNRNDLQPMLSSSSFSWSSLTPIYDQAVSQPASWGNSPFFYAASRAISKGLPRHGKGQPSIP